MKVRIVWKSRQGCNPRENAHARLQSVLLAALNTRFYRPLLESCALGTRHSILGLRSVEEVLARLPSVDVCTPGVRSRALVDYSVSANERREIYWPLPPAASTAILMEGYRRRRGVRSFARAGYQAIARYSPDAIAGPVSEIRRLAEAIQNHEVQLPPLRHSLIAFAILRHAFLSEETRDLFWRVFQVPVFGQILSLEGEVLAWECEAHEGYHVDAGNAIFETVRDGREPGLTVTSLVDLRCPVLRMDTALTGRMEHSTCGCGLAGPRLLDVRRRSLAKVAAMAASASCAAD